MYPESPRERIPKLAPRLQKLLRTKGSTFRKGSTGSKQATPLCPLNQATPKEAQICCHPGDLLVSYSFRVIGQKSRVGVVNTKTAWRLVWQRPVLRTNQLRKYENV